MKKGIFSKLIVTFVIIANALFTAGIMYIFLRTSCEPITLIGSWFTFTTVELWQLATIKKRKVDKND